MERRYYSNVVHGWKDDGARKSGETTCPTCQTTVPLHGMHWVTEICPGCCQMFHWGLMADYNLYTAAGFWPPETFARIVANLEANGRYVPSH